MLIINNNNNKLVKKTNFCDAALSVTCYKTAVSLAAGQSSRGGHACMGL